MRTRIIQRKPKSPDATSVVSADADGPDAPRRQANHVAARMGRWSATHRTKAVLIWVLFVVAAVAAGAMHPMSLIDRNDKAVGEAARGNAILESSFDTDEEGLGEFVLVQSDDMTVDDPAFRAAISDVERAVSSFDEVTELHSPLEQVNNGQISPDRHAVMVSFVPKGTYDEAALYIDDITAAVGDVQKAHPDMYIGNAGVSTEKALQATIQGQIAKAGLIAVPLTILILVLVLGSLTSSLVPVGLSLSAVFASMGLTAAASSIVPMDASVNEVILLVGLAVGVDYSLFYIRRERDERRAGRSAQAALQAAAATSGRSVLISGITVMIAMAGMFLSGDPMFVSFAVGTIIAVLVAMVGSLTVLPAILSMLGDRIERIRIPFLGRRRGEEGRVWGAILRPVLRRPLLAAGLATGVLVALALPATQMHTAESGMDALPKSMPELQTFHELNDAFPGSSTAAMVALRADDTPQTQAAIQDLIASARASGEMQEPMDVTQSDDGSVYQIDIPLAGSGTNKESDHALDDAAERAHPRHDRHPPRRRVRGDRPDRRLQGLHRRDEAHRSARVRLRPALRLPAPAGGLPLHRGRREGHPAQPAQRRCGLRRPRRGLPVGLG